MPARESLQREYAVKPQGGDGIKEGSLDPYNENDNAQEPPGGGSQGVTDSFLESWPFQCWHGVENVAKVRINQESCMAILDSDTQINAIMPNYVKNHSLEVRLITDLIGTRCACLGLGNVYTHPLGYVIVWVHVDGVQGYDKDQIALVIPDESKFVEWVPIILGTLTISCIMNVMKEREIDALVIPWANARVRHLLSMWRAAATVLEDQTLENANPNGYDKVVFMRNAETIEAFSSWILSVKVEKAYTGECINIITQALQTEDVTLPHGLTIQYAYTELQKGSKYIIMVVRNSTAYPKMLQKKAPVARAVAATMVLETPPDRVWEGDDGHQDPHPPSLTTRQRQGKLFEELDLSRLNSRPLELAEATHWLLAEYHDVFC